MKPRKDLDANCQRFLDYLVSLKQEPVVMSVRTMDVIFERSAQPIIPSLASRLAMLRRLEKLKAIRYKREGKYKFKPQIIILKSKI